MDWETINSATGNQVLRGDEFYISYATATGLQALGGGFAGDGDDETALVVDGKFFILNGDFREDYERLAPEGAEACMAFFREKNDRSSWSNDPA